MLTDIPATGAKAGASGGVVKDTTTAGFRQDVITESMNQPVLVDFWSPRSPACKALSAVLERIVAGAGGKVKLVRLNVDEHPAVFSQIGQQLGLEGVPAVIALDRGRPVDMFSGAVPEAEVKAFVMRLIGPSEIDQLLQEADRLAGEGDHAQASEIFTHVIREEPDNVRAYAGLAKGQLDLGQPANARQVLEMVPAEKTADPALAGVRAALELAEQAESLGDLTALQQKVEANGDDYQARFDLALGLNANGRRDEAVDQLVAIARRDRTWNEEAARKQLLQFFEAWGLMDPAAIRGRRQLSTLIFS
ncbi:thioredoxin family protein [Methylobacterium haplocladii]|uniref:Thioredoxin n=1 Tax=Methylobacterium haplocladii TaxID=1176176 RepID=A0A512INC8_9HYPH|nr:co-chaperone YbbN [Methylobacterium haplocladii]GEO99200.1 thioredoxin [Methylobacterium haplocladii]GJD83156.1 Chaperedoxin [Methylobacterium haplocladii]